VPLHVRRYDIGGVIAAGGMAEIVAASAVSEPGVAKRVALKRIRTEMSADPVFVGRFFDEVRLAMQLSHANVVQVFDFGRTESNDFFLTMEFVEGVDVQRLRRTSGCERLPPAEALHIVAQTLRGLDYAHRRTDSDDRPLGIVHLDVKPANVLLSFEGEVKLTDFGVARSRDVHRPVVGISGTVPFMSPEQARGENVDLRSDVFSAGVLLYALLTGECPFGEEDAERTLAEVRRCRYRPPVEVERFHPFDSLLRRALDPAPDQRFASAGAFADAIEELMFEQGWRGGVAALRERLRQAFPRERERLNALFDPGKQREGFEVSRPSSAREGALLSRIAAVEAPARRTLVAAPVPGGRAQRRRRALVSLAVFAAVAAAAAVIVVAQRRPAPAPEVARPQGQASRAAPPAPTPPPPRATQSAAVTAGHPQPIPAAVRKADRGERPPAGTGTLSVNASPWGTVYVNGHQAGTTPLLRYPLRAGRAQVAIENPKLGRKVMDVKIEPNKDTPLIVDLRPADPL
jgi:eukaryotic-like serine/threonine-protein kinase